MNTPPNQEINNSSLSQQTKRYGWYGFNYSKPIKRDDEEISPTDLRSSVETLMERIQQGRISHGGHEPPLTHNSHTTAGPDAINTDIPPAPNHAHKSHMSSETIIHNSMKISENETDHSSDTDSFVTEYEGASLSRCDHRHSRPAPAPSLGRFTENFGAEHAISQEEFTPAEGEGEGEGEWHHQVTTAAKGNKPWSQRRRRRRRVRRGSWFSLLRLRFMARLGGIRGNGSPRREEKEEEGRDRS